MTHAQVKDLENKLKESEGSSLVLQQKVKDYENKLKDSESNSLVWQQKVRRPTHSFSHLLCLLFYF